MLLSIFTGDYRANVEITSVKTKRFLNTLFLHTEIKYLWYDYVLLLFFRLNEQTRRCEQLHTALLRQQTQTKQILESKHNL